MCGVPGAILVTASCALYLIHNVIISPPAAPPSRLKCRRAVLTMLRHGRVKKVARLNRARASASKGLLAFNGYITCCSGVSATVEALRQAQIH